MYRAVDLYHNSKVRAVKVLPAEVAREPGAVDKLRREADVAQELTHPSIVRLHTFDMDQAREGMAFLVMQFIDGQSLARLLVAHRQGLAPARVLSIAQPVAGIVFVLDGVLIGAGDAVYLAWAQLVSLVLFAPAAWVCVVVPDEHGLTLLWVAFAVFFMGTRAVTLLLRANGDAWMRLGAAGVTGGRGRT